MDLQFKYILPGVGVRRREEQRQTAVYGRTVGLAERQIGGLARPQRPATKHLHEGAQPAPRNAHDAHCPSARRGSNGGDRFVVSGQHVRQSMEQCAREIGAAQAGDAAQGPPPLAVAQSGAAAPGEVT